MMKKCRRCKKRLDASSFCQSKTQPDGLARVCRSCVNTARRTRYATAKSAADRGNPARLQDLIKKGDLAAIKRSKSLIHAGNREQLLALAVRDFKSAPKKSSHVDLVKFLIEMGASPAFHLVCAATVGPHVEIMNALIEAGAEHNIFTAAARGDIDRLRELLAIDPTLADATTGSGMTALHYACLSELGKRDEFCAEKLYLCAAFLLDQMSKNGAESGRGVSANVQGSPLEMCAWRGGNVKIAQLLIRHGWQPTVGTVLAALGHFQRHGHGNYEVAALCLDSGVDINEMDGRTLLHAFAHQGDLVGTRWLLDHGAKLDVRDDGNNTPLHKACERNSTLTVVQLLLERGASLTATNTNGETALDLAIKNDKKSIVSYLRRLRA